MRIDLVGQLCAGEVWASARPAARVAAKANAAHHVKTLRMLALRSLVLSNPSCRKPLADHLPLEGGGRPASAGREGVTALQRVLRRCHPTPDRLRRSHPPPAGEGGRAIARCYSLPQTLEPAAVEIERDAGDVACPFR